MTAIAAAEMLRSSPVRGWAACYFHTDNITVARWDIDHDADDVYPHRHPYGHQEHSARHCEGGLWSFIKPLD